MYTVTRKTHQNCLSYLLQNLANSDNGWCVLSWVNLPYSNVSVFYLTWIMCLLYLVKQEYRKTMNPDRERVEVLVYIEKTVQCCIPKTV